MERSIYWDSYQQPSVFVKRFLHVSWLILQTEVSRCSHKDACYNFNLSNFGFYTVYNIASNQLMSLPQLMGDFHVLFNPCSPSEFWLFVEDLT